MQGEQGRKTREQQQRMRAKTDDVPKPGDPAPGDVSPTQTVRSPEARQSEMPVSRGGMDQESRQHNKHNRSA